MLYYNKFIAVKQALARIIQCPLISRFAKNEELPSNIYTI